MRLSICEKLHGHIGVVDKSKTVYAIYVIEGARWNFYYFQKNSR